MKKLININEEVTKSVPIVRGKVYVVASYSGGCKTTTCTNIADPLLKQNEKVLWITNEHSEEDIVMRIACLREGLNFNDYLKGNMPIHKQREALGHFKNIRSNLKVASLIKDNTLSGLMWMTTQVNEFSCVLVDHVSIEDKEEIVNGLAYLEACKKQYKSDVVVPAIILFVNTPKYDPTIPGEFIKTMDFLNIESDVILEVAPSQPSVGVDMGVNIVVHKNILGPKKFKIELAFNDGKYVSKPCGMDRDRKKAITILEKIAEMLGDEEIFDCKDGDDKRWYRFEDAVVEILGGKNE